MDLKGLIADDDAVSPVIGVILMVAITVILAAVIGTFVLGLGQNVSQTAPSVSMSFSDHSDNYAPDDATAPETAFVITKNSGGTLVAGELKILIKTGGSTVATLEGTSWSATSGSTIQLTETDSGTTAPAAEDELSTGLSWYIRQTADSTTGDGSVLSDNSDHTITIVHKPSDSTIFSSTVELS